MARGKKNEAFIVDDSINKIGYKIYVIWVAIEPKDNKFLKLVHKMSKTSPLQCFYCIFGKGIRETSSFHRGDAFGIRNHLDSTKAYEELACTVFVDCHGKNYVYRVGTGPNLLAIIVAIFFWNRNAIFESFLLMVEKMPISKHMFL